jgi:alcohol dehydrogenase (cytochrome c)
MAAFMSALPGCEASSGADVQRPDRWWPSYGGTYANTRHVDLEQIGPKNVGGLRVAWKFNTGVYGSFETSPIVVDGVMYFTTGPDNAAYALDAATGRLKWHYVPTMGHAPYIFNVNRGVAVAGGKVFLTTMDDRLIALDARTGKPLWDSRIGDPDTGMREDAAPLAWDGLVFVGSAGNEMGVRGSYSAFRQSDGKLAWRWYAVSAGWEGTFRNSAQGYSLHRNIAAERAALAKYRDAWKNGGGAVWMTPALSPDEAAIYLSTGNPAPAFAAERRPGDNLYTDCIVALDAHTGKMKWYYQETPHDVWDYDASSPPVLVEARDASGRPVPAVAEAGKTGWLYVVDRKTGKLLHTSAPFVPQPHVYPRLSDKGEPVQPGDMGGAIGPIAYDPAAHAAFVAGNVQPETGERLPLPTWKRGNNDQWTGGNMTEVPTIHGAGLLSAIDTDTGRVRWSSSVPDLVFGGPLSTNGLVFLGEQETGAFKAYDAATGRVLWQVNPGDALLSRFDLHDRTQQFVSTLEVGIKSLVHRVRHEAQEYSFEDIHAPPIAYRMRGREYIAIASNVYERRTRPGGNTIFAFALP